VSTAIPRLFVLRRDTDVTGVSGAGDVADGVQWPDGSVVLRWRERPSTAVWDSLDLMLSVHGHDGATRVVWTDQADQADQQARAAAGRAYLLADRWQAAHEASQFLVRVAGAELRDELDDAGECDHRLMPMLSGIVSGGPCIKRGPHDEHETADGTKFSPIGTAQPPTQPVIPWTGPEPSWAADLRASLAGDGEPEHGRAVSSCSNPDHACVKCGHCAYEHPGEGGCIVGQLPPTEGRSARTACKATASQGPPNQGPLTGIEVRDPCPYCEGCPLIPRALMDGHIREQHPEIREGGPGIPVPDAEPDAPGGIRSLLEHVGVDTRGRNLTVAGRVVDARQKRAECPHCPDGHQSPTGGSQPWSAWVGPARDGDGEATTIHVARSGGAHVAESDAQWVRHVLNARQLAKEA
jgi:hypothetical protein